MRIAITADWLVAAGGAERVIAEMHALFPDAPIFTTVYKEGCLPSLTAGARVSSLQKWYRLLGDHRLLLPLMPRAAESWDLRGFDVILSSSHAVAKGCLPPSAARHICYCHTPMRYAWEMEERYLNDFRLRGPLRLLAKRELEKLRRWDLSTSKRVDLFIANSRTTQERIRRFYGRDSIVLHPPVDERFFQEPLFSSSDDPELARLGRRVASPTVVWRGRVEGESSRGFSTRPSTEPVLSLAEALGTPSKKTYFLALGRLVPYKRFDLLIEAANALKIPLKIAGDGPDGSRLKRLAGNTVEFLGHVPDKALPALYRDATAFLYPTHEDAGIAVLEAQACGTPVIALGKGGALETILEGKTGLFFSRERAEDLRDALERFGELTFDPAAIREHARKFSSTKFRERLLKIVESAA